jgi:hypothetical protein
MRQRRVALGVIFYGGLVTIITGILVEIFPKFLPGAVADRISQNSEGFVLALIMALWIQFVRPGLSGATREWPITLAAASICLAIGVFLLVTDFPSKYRTLNETFLAAAILIPYVQIRRPLPSRQPIWLSVALLAVIVVGHRTQAITDLAETFGMLMLAPIGFDLVDRGILDPKARTSTALRYGWYAFLVVAPIAFSVLEYGIGFEGAIGEATRYAVRIYEAFLFMLLVELYFAVALGGTGSSTRPSTRHTVLQ